MKQYVVAVPPACSNHRFVDTSCRRKSDKKIGKRRKIFQNKMLKKAGLDEMWIHRSKYHYLNLFYRLTF